MKYRLIFIVLLLALIIPTSSQAQRKTEPEVLISGSDNLSNFEAFSLAAAAGSVDKQINLLILPLSLTSEAFPIEAGKQKETQEKAESVRSEMEAACRKALAQTAQAQAPNCTVKIASLFLPKDAENKEILSLFEEALDGIYLLASNPHNALQVISGTPIETALNQAYQDGVLLAGSAPGLFSSAIIQVATQGSHLDSRFNFGAVSVLSPPELQALDFNLPGSLVESQVYAQNQVNALLRAITLSRSHSLGVGIDDSAALLKSGSNRLQVITGSSPVLILDAHTYQAVQSVRYTGAFQPTGAGNILAHWLLPSDQFFDIESRRHSLAPPAERIVRNSQPLRLPSGAGSLFLSADLSETRGLSQALTQFINQAGGQRANLLLLAIGYADAQGVQKLAEVFEKAAGIPIQTLSLPIDASSIGEIPADVTGVIISAPSTVTVDPRYLQSTGQSIGPKWRAGLPVWLNNAAAAWVGTDTIQDPANGNLSTAFLLDAQQIQPALNWLPITLRSHIWDENHWSEIYSLAYHHPQSLALGLPARTGLEISQLGARVWGEDVLFTLDFSQAVLADGSAANSLIDFFAPQEMLSFQAADQNAEPLAANTPALPTATFTQQVITPSLTPSPTATFTATPIPTETPRVRPSATIKPTQTPPPIPPAPDPARMNFMVVITVIMVIIILFGVWLNRQWIKDQY